MEIPLKVNKVYFVDIKHGLQRAASALYTLPVRGCQGSLQFEVATFALAGVGERDAVLAAVDEQVGMEDARHDLLEDGVEDEWPQESNEAFDPRLVQLLRNFHNRHRLGVAHMLLPTTGWQGGGETQRGWWEQGWVSGKLMQHRGNAASCTGMRAPCAW